MILQTAIQFELYQQPPFCPRSEGIQGRPEWVQPGLFPTVYGSGGSDVLTKHKEQLHLCQSLTFHCKSWPWEVFSLNATCALQIINRGICLHFICSLLYVSDLRGLHNPAQHCDSLQCSTIFSLISSYLRNAAAHSGETSFIVLYKGLYIFPSWKGLLQHSYL